MAARERDDYDDEDRPRRRPRPADEFEEGEPPRRQRRPRDDFDDEPPRQRRPRDEDDEDEDDRTRRRRPRDDFDDDEDYDDRPRRRRRRRGPAEPSGLVTALAVINYVLGGLAVLAGLFVLFAGSWFLSFFGAAAANPGFRQGQAGQQAAAQMQGLAGLGMLIVVFAVIVTLVIAMLYILTGYGLQQRKQWGRVLAIILGILNALSAVVGLLGLPVTFIRVIFSGAYAGLTLAVLFQPSYAEEFE